MTTNDIISVGIFFDGTGNNGINATSKQKPTKNNESYHSSTTNIYKLFGLFAGNQKIYIEGIGTITGAEDSNYAMGTCKNPVGYVGYSSDDKLAIAYDFIEEIMQDKSSTYEFYVYGFSRGAMLARNFCYELLKPDSKISGNVKVKFLGVFDTVESTPFTKYNVDVLPGVENALHVCAINECRYFFPLTGIFASSNDMMDAESKTGESIWKEIFVPGAHADVGGGYLEASESVYVSANYRKNEDIDAYIANVRETLKDSNGNEVWNYLLDGFQIDEGTFFSQAYISRKIVYNDLSKVYGKLMLEETNAQGRIFSTDFNASNFEINSQLHPYLLQFSNELETYVNNIFQNPRPVYSYDKFVGYTHISANFGLHKSTLLQKTEGLVNAELINHGLNIPSNADTSEISPAEAKFQSKVYLLEDGSVTDYAYGANIPNNNDWIRTILTN